MKVSRTIGILIFSIICVTITGGLLLVASYLLNQEGKELQAKMQAVADEQKLITERNQIKSTIDASASDRAELAGFIIDGDDGTAAFLSEMDALAAKLGVTITTQLKVVEQEKATFDLLSVSFAVEGADSSVRRFVSLLEKVPYKSQLTALQLSKGQDPNTGRITSSGSITMEVSITNI